MATFGYEDNGDNHDIVSVDGHYACKFSLTENGHITNLSARSFAVTSTKGRMYIYSDDGGAPSKPHDLLATSDEVAIAGVGWYDFPCVVDLTTGTYWLTMEQDGNFFVYYLTVGDANQMSYNFGGASYPATDDPWVHDGFTAFKCCYHADYTPSGGVSKKRMLMGVGLMAKTPKFTARKVVPWKCPLPLYP